MSTTLHLVRHGVTASNRAQRYMGRSEEPLASDGRLQARHLARRLASRDIAAMYSSPLRRTKETAAIIAQPHALDVEVAVDFNELDLSRWEGLTAAEVEARDPQAWQTWCREPARLKLTGIEAFGRLRERVRRGLQALVKRHEGAGVVVVTHDGIIRVAVVEGLGLDVGIYRSLPVDNTGLTTLEFSADRVYLRALNDTGHLDDSLRVARPGPADR